MTIRSMLWLAPICTLITNCSMPDDVKETKETSKEIESESKKLGDTSSKVEMQSRRLSENSDRLAEQSRFIAERSGNIFYGGRKDLGFERPDERFKELLAADGDAMKIRYATALCTSFEFQQWVGNFTDTKEVHERLYAKALRDLFAMTESLINHDYRVDTTVLGGLASGSPDNRWKTLASLAVALGEIDADQAIAAKAMGTEPESLYSLIVKGLELKTAANQGQTIPEYARFVLDYSDEATFLLQLRHNYFTAMVMSRFSTFATGPIHELSAFLGGLNPGMPDNLIKIEDQGILWLEAAQETQRILASDKHLHVPLQFNSTIRWIFLNTRFEIPKAIRTTPALERAFTTLNKRISELQQTYKTGVPSPASRD